VAHEFGHLLGLGDEYDDPTMYQKGLMARGNEMRVQYYFAWINAMYTHKAYRAIKILPD
jgi:hypothetical protein